MARLFFTPQAVRINSAGTPYASAEANFYLTGTSTRTDSYTDNAITTPHANPVVADSAGQFAAIYLDPAITYRCIITEASAGATIDDIDPVHAPFDAGDVTVTDTGGYFAGTEVETVLQDLGANYAKLSSTETITANWTFSGADLSMVDNEIQRPEIKDYGISHFVSTATSTVTFNMVNGNSFVTTLTENTTVTLANPSITGVMCQCIIKIIQDGAGGAYTVTWPASVQWPGGTAPTMTVTNDAVDIFTLVTIDAGTTWYGNFAQAFA